VFVNNGKAPKTIAVIPFVNLSSDQEQEYFVDGLSEEILNSLAQIPDLTVIARTSSFTFKGSNKKIQEIANELGVENILEGSVRKAGDALRITAQLVKAVDGSHLWSKTYDRELKDIFAVQEDIASAVAGELKATLGIDKSLKQLGGTDNEKAYELYLIAKGQSNNINFDPKSLQETIDAAIASDPNFALAWALKASIHQTNAHLADSNSNITKELDMGLQAVQKAIEIEPNLAEAYAVLGGQKAARGEWVEAESAYHKALELEGESTLEVGNYSIFLFALGYFEKAKKFIEASLKNDPLNQNMRGKYMMDFVYLGENQRAKEQNELGNRLFGEDQFPINSWIICINSKDYSFDEILKNLWMITDEQKLNMKSPKDCLAYLNRTYNNEANQNFGLADYSDAAAYFGDPEPAMDITEKLINLQAMNISSVWFPVHHEIRQLPRYKKLVRDVGLVDYWNNFGWPDMCHQLDNGDFECE
jgi:TolB-like protein/Tfp pilus assembly protein PilF